MSIRQPLSLPENTPEGELLKVLEPYLWVDRVVPVHRWARTAGTWYEVSGTVRAPEVTEALTATDQEHALALAQLTRDSLFGRAQTAICAAEEAGYIHDRHPEISVGGDIYRDEEADLDLLRAEVTVRLWLRKAAAKR